MSNNIFDFWPIDSPPRSKQKTALEWLEQQDKKYLFIEAPVGSGKSLLAITYSRFVNNGNGDSFILTPQRILQEQYINEFADNKQVQARALYGKSNYQCLKSYNENTYMSCDVGASTNPNNKQCQGCPYDEQKSATQKSPNAILNYKSASLFFAFTQVFSSRKTLVFDECHNLEKTLIDFESVSINRNRIQQLNIKWRPLSEIKQARDWVIETYKPAVEERLVELEDQLENIDNESLTPEQIHFVKEYNKLLDHSENLRIVTECPEDVFCDNFVLVHNDLSISFKPLYAKRAFKSILEPQAERFVFMSGTIPDKEQFCNNLGIDPDQAAFLSLDSDFPAENRPVVYLPTMKVNSSWNNDNRSSDRNRMISTLEQISSQHQDESGIIHTASFAISKWLCEQLEKNKDFTHKIYHHNPETDDDRNKVISAFQNESKPSVLISPSITEGLDLTQDLGRFNVIAKIPFPYLGDQWIKARMEKSNRWYRCETVISLLQASGRTMRSSDDYSVFYILDTCWEMLLNSSSDMIPSWWFDQYHVIN